MFARGTRIEAPKCTVSSTITACPPMPKPFEPLSIEKFAAKLRDYQFTRRVTAVHMHHTWRPTKANYAGLSTIEGMWRFHTDPKPKGNGWADIAQHLSIAPDGTIWTGRDWNRTPASASGFSEGSFMFETIGDFDKGRETLAGAQRQSVVEVIARVQLKCGLPVESLRFHRDFTNQKTCPGTGVDYQQMLAEVREARARITGAPRGIAVAAGNGASTSRRSSAYAVGGGAATSRDAAARPFADQFVDSV